jgi:sugar (pentulose or hexulose) kinase
MPSAQLCVNERAIIAGLDFSTGAVKGIAFALDGTSISAARLPTDLWTADGVSELNLMQLEGQARAIVRKLAAHLRERGRLQDWKAIGISATHHTAGRIDSEHVQVRRAICWNDQTLPQFHRVGLQRLGGPARVMGLIGGPWASRYSLSHLVKDETTLGADDWRRTRWILPHGPLAAGYLTGRFDVTSVSSAASTGLMDLRTNQWCPEMLGALQSAEYRALVRTQLPQIVDARAPIGPLSDNLAHEAGIELGHRPLVFPTSDDQQAGLIGGGAVDAGEVAIILGNSAVVNSSADGPPQSEDLDAMKLNWGPYLWMRCYNNGAQFLDTIVGANPDWSALERAARQVPPGCQGISVLPFVLPEPSRGIDRRHVEWTSAEPTDPGIRFRAALEALAYLIALGVEDHERAGQSVRRVIVSGGIAKSDLMVEILASVLNRPIERLESTEGPALGAAVTALWGLETVERCRQGVAEVFAIRAAVDRMVRYRDKVLPSTSYLPMLQAFRQRLAERAGK